MGTNRLKVLIVDDDSHIGDVLKMNLEENGFLVTHVTDGERGLQLARDGGYGVVILDVMLPSRDGFDICRELRKAKTPCKILMLTFRSEEIDKVLGLELGADDYVGKPFSVREIVARVRVLTRRMTEENDPIEPILELGSLKIDPNSRETSVRGQGVALTTTEFDLLYFLAKHPGRAFTREHLLHAVWGYTSAAYEHTVNTHINRLRIKIERDPANPDLIKTVWGVGYKCAPFYAE